MGNLDVTWFAQAMSVLCCVLFIAAVVSVLTAFVIEKMAGSENDDS